VMPSGEELTIHTHTYMNAYIYAHINACIHTYTGSHHHAAAAHLIERFAVMPSEKELQAEEIMAVIKNKMRELNAIMDVARLGLRQGDEFKRYVHVKHTYMCM
jgi:hypothetical protein